MTVKELIIELQKYNPELDVVCNYSISNEPHADDVEDYFFNPTWVQEREATKHGEGYILIRE